MKNTKRLLLIIFSLICMICAAVAVAACNPDAGNHNIPGLGDSVVISVRRDNLSFAKGMNVDASEILERCGLTLKDSEGHEVAITAQYLNDGTVSYEKFDLQTVGSGKIKVSYKSAEVEISYEVKEYAVNFVVGGQTWKTVPAAAVLDENLDLSVTVDLSAYNYSTDAEARAHNAATAVRFNGWYNTSEELQTGVKPVDGVIGLHAKFLSEQEFADYDISYDNRGRRVFSGYKGSQTETLSVPEGVTYVNLTALFSTPLKFGKLHLPSTAKMDLPFSRGVNSTGLTAITVDEANPDYSSHNGALYSKNFSVLYFMPANCTVIGFHENLTEFGSYSCAYWHITSLVIPEGVDTLQHYCFAYSELSDVEGLDDVKHIMSGVFYGTAMSVDHGIALYVLQSGSGGTAKYSLSIVLDKTVTEYTVLPGTVSIAGGAFSGCDKLVSVDLGDEVETIGGSAFSGCTSLKSIKLPASLKTAGSALFYNCTSLETVTGLTDITFSEGRTYVAHAIPDDTFYGCSSLSEISLPDELEYIGESAFSGCLSLERLALPETVKTAGERAFYGCGFTQINLPSSLVSLGEAAFSHSALENIDLTTCPQLAELPERCFEYTAMTSVTVPDRFASIPAFCFYYMRSLQRVDLGSITELGERVFGYCNNLTEIVWSDRLEVIGSRAFTNCTAITEIVIPDTVTEVGGYAFQNCTSLTKITLGRGVTSFGTYAFESDGVTFGTVTPALYTCNNLTEISVAAGNTQFKAVEGVLYANSVGGKTFGEGAVLIAVPQNYKNSSLALPAAVKVITPYAVHNQKVLSTVALNHGLENIGKAAFYNSASLTELKIPSTVTNIGASILLNCKNVTSFTVDADNRTYSTDGNLIYTGDTLIMYMGLSEDVTVREGTVKIGDAVFMNNTVIESVVIPDSVTSIGLRAFYGCTKLKSITIGSGLTELDPTAFASLPALETVTVAEGNTRFKAENNILYSKDGKKLILCAAQNGLTSLDIAEGVTDIGNWAFAYHATLKAAELPDSVKTVGDYAFYECRAMEYFFGSQSLESIGERAFSFATSVTPSDNTETRYCDTLKTVMLYGNMQSIGDYAFYGQYGLTGVFFKMTPEETVALIAGSGTNISYLTHGCPVGATGKYYNDVKRYIYHEAPPDDFTINIDGYEWFFINEDGNPEPWKK